MSTTLEGLVSHKLIEVAAFIEGCWTQYFAEPIVGRQIFFRSIQEEACTCAPHCVYMALRNLGYDTVPVDTLIEALQTNSTGTYWTAMGAFLRAYGLRTEDRKTLAYSGLVRVLRTGGLAIVGVDGDHVGVVYGVDAQGVYFADPSYQRTPRTYIPHSEFTSRWGVAGRCLAVFERC